VIQTTTYSEVILGPPENVEIEPSSTRPPSPDPSDEAPVDDSIGQDKSLQLKWSAEMIEALAEYIYGVWKDGRAADNGFKREVWIEAANVVARVYQGSLPVTYDKCKNKWGDLKEKWKHWLVLSDQSGFGWKEEKEKFEAHDYVWENLNKTYPRIIWHKTHIMPHRELFSEVLHEAQATGKGAISIFDSDEGTVFPIDPRLLNDSTSSVSPVPNSGPKMHYNKSRKRVRTQGSDDEDEGTLAQVVKKIDLGHAITSLSIEMARRRRLREEHKSDQEKAVQLLETEYGDRLDTMVFIAGCTFFEDEHKARSFLAISSVERRDRWLEINLGTELQERA
jgi:hypothetical protein